MIRGPGAEDAFTGHCNHVHGWRMHLGRAPKMVSPDQKSSPDQKTPRSHYHSIPTKFPDHTCALWGTMCGMGSLFEITYYYYSM